MSGGGEVGKLTMGLYYKDKKLLEIVTLSIFNGSNDKFIRFVSKQLHQIRKIVVFITRCKSGFVFGAQTCFTSEAS